MTVVSIRPKVKRSLCTTRAVFVVFFLVQLLFIITWIGWVIRFQETISPPHPVKLPISAVEALSGKNAKVRCTAKAMSELPPVARSDLVALHDSMVRHYEARTDAGLSRVHENFPELAWGNANFSGGINRTHFRSHYPLYTLQTLWDHADHHYQNLGTRKFGFPARWNVTGAKYIKDGEVIFVNQVWKNWLVKVAPRLRANVTIILFDGDSRFCDSPEARKLKEMPNVVRIFAPNACPHPKVAALPLGVEDNLEFPKSSKHWTFHGDELKLSKFLLQQTRDVKKSGVFCDMSVGSNYNARQPAMAMCERLKQDANAGVEVEMGALAKGAERRTWEAYLTDLARHRFVVSPEGNGYDCHRTWEALLVGSIPVVQHADGVRDVYRGLPVLYVESYANVTAELLESEWDKFENAPAGTYEYERLFAPYWVDRIRSTSAYSQAIC